MDYRKLSIDYTKKSVCLDDITKSGLDINYPDENTMRFEWYNEVQKGTRYYASGYASDIMYLPDWAKYALVVYSHAQ